MYNDLSIRYKLFFSYAIAFTICFSLGGIFVYTILEQSITKNIESELQNTTATIHNMVSTAVNVSIKNRLRSVAEKDREIARYYYQQARSGQMSEAQAKQKAAELFLIQTIGKSGYTYCLDSHGTVLVHPEKELLGVNVAEYAFVKRMMEKKEGYIEYQWKNPSEQVERPKALYMTWFEPWDWIISVSSYRREFRDVVNVEDFKASILGLRFGDTGYSFVIDNQGNAIIHPKLQGINILEEKSLPNDYLEIMRSRKKGKIIYPWRNPGELKPRKKLVIFNTIAEYDWIVASSSYLEEFNHPLNTIRTLLLVTGLVALGLILLLTFRISDSIINPLKKLMLHFNRVRETNFTARMECHSKDEIGQLTLYFNSFMDQLEKYSHDLNAEISNRIKVENELRESEGRYRSVMEAAPDPIVVYTMSGEVIFFNPAFTRVFGWSLDKYKGRKMDHFVPAENWSETQLMIETIASGNTLDSTETCRYHRKGSIVPVSISGASYRDHNGQLAGSVIILRDITNAKRLQKQIMDIADSVRQRIGQDLHDDLCPHLIGTQGLATVLAANLREEHSAHEGLAAKIATLIESGIDKSRSLARGLCPVHLVSHGLFTALEDLARRTERTSGIRCHFDGDEGLIFNDNTVATHLYFMVQEAAVNAVKHSKATQIWIRMDLKNSMLDLMIKDNGRGFVKNAALNGIGLQIIAYRAKIIGAMIKIDTQIGQGTTIQIVMKNQDGPKTE